MREEGAAGQCRKHHGTYMAFMDEIVLEMSDNQKLKWSWSQMRLLAILSEDKLEGI